MERHRRIRPGSPGRGAQVGHPPQAGPRAAPVRPQPVDHLDHGGRPRGPQEEGARPRGDRRRQREGQGAHRRVGLLGLRGPRPGREAVRPLQPPRQPHRPPEVRRRGRRTGRHERRDRAQAAPARRDTANTALRRGHARRALRRGRQDLRGGRRCDGGAPPRQGREADVRGPEQPRRAVGGGLRPPLPEGEGPPRHGVRHLVCRRNAPLLGPRGHGRLGRRDRRAVQVLTAQGVGRASGGGARAQGPRARGVRGRAAREVREGQLHREAGRGPAAAAQGEHLEAPRRRVGDRGHHVRGPRGRLALRRRGPQLQEPCHRLVARRRRRHEYGRPEGRGHARQVRLPARDRPWVQHHLRNGDPRLELHERALQPGALPRPEPP